MGKVQHSKQATRPAAQSHTAHKFDSPRHGKTPTGFTVKPAKRELVPIYNVNQRVSFDTPAKQALGAMLLLGTLGSVIKGAQATECVNPRPANPTVRGVASNVTVNCYDNDLFYGQNLQLPDDVVSRVSQCPYVYPLYGRTCVDDSPTQWGWSYHCTKHTWYVTGYSTCVTYESQPGAIHTKVCRSQSWGVEVHDVWGTTDPRRTLGTDDDFQRKCNDVVAQCDLVKGFVCEPPTTPAPPTTSGSSSGTSGAPTSPGSIPTDPAGTGGSNPQPLPSQVIIGTASSSATASIADEIGPTPSPNSELIEDDGGNSTGAKVAGSLIGIAAAGGIVGAGLVAARKIYLKKQEKQVGHDDTVDKQNGTNAATQNTELELREEHFY